MQAGIVENTCEVMLSCEVWEVWEMCYIKASIKMRIRKSMEIPERYGTLLRIIAKVLKVKGPSEVKS